MREPTPEEVARAKAEMAREDEIAEQRRREQAERDRPIVEENQRRSQLPSEHPDHICGMMCDGQDGWNSYCARLREKLFGKR